MNKKLWITIGVIVAIILIFSGWIISSYNGLIRNDETVNEKWANVNSAYQRRADLIPNLIETVKGFAAQEKKIFIGVTEARTKWLNSQTKSTPQNIQMNAARNMDSAISRLLVTVENYPKIKSNENFLSLQDELAGTENRIKVERDIFNKAVKDYNIQVRGFPTIIIANIFGFTKKEMFEADKGAENAPKVKF